MMRSMGQRRQHVSHVNLSLVPAPCAMPLIHNCSYQIHLVPHSTVSLLLPFNYPFHNNNKNFIFLLLLSYIVLLSLSMGLGAIPT